MTLFDWHRVVEEFHQAMSGAVSTDQWSSFHVYGSSSDGFEGLPQICYEAKVNNKALVLLCEYIVKHSNWLPSVDIHVTKQVIEL